jgi:hypothetical protein
MGRGQHVTVKKAQAAKPRPGEILDRNHQLGTDHLLLRRKESWHGDDSVLRRLCVATSPQITKLA